MKNFTEPRNLMLHTQNKNTRVSKEWFGQIPTIPNSSTAPGSFVCTSACCYSGNPSWQFILGSNVFCLSWKLVCFRISVEQQQLDSYSEMNIWKIMHLLWMSGHNRARTYLQPHTAMGCRQCLPLSVVQLKGKHCQNPHCLKWTCRYVQARNSIGVKPAYLSVYLANL